VTETSIPTGLEPRAFWRAFRGTKAHLATVAARGAGDRGHLDMVRPREPDRSNDPAPRGGSSSRSTADWLTANGTTLGADDGVEIAAMMGLIEDDSLPHGPLLLLMTVDEEVGLEGANGLDSSLVEG